MDKTLFNNLIGFQEHVRRATKAVLREDFEELFAEFPDIQRIEIKVNGTSGHSTWQNGQQVYHTGSSWVQLDIFKNREGLERLDHKDITKIRKRFKDSDLDADLLRSLFKGKTWKFYRQDGDPLKELPKEEAKVATTSAS